MESKSDLIYNHIESQIIQGELKSKDKLPTESELCEQWQTSRSSVRQALERLLALGILHKVRGGGTYVSAPDQSIFTDPLMPFVLFRDESLESILEFRKILEVGTIRLSAVFRSPENLEELGQLILAMKEPSINSESYAVLDLRFHMEIARASQNQIAVNVYQMLASILKKHQSELNRLLGMSFSVKEHENILLALKEGSPELSAYFMEKHLMRTISELRQYLSHTDKPK